MKISLNHIMVAIGAKLPLRLSARIFRWAVGNAHVAICLHRVGNRSVASGSSQLHSDADQLDRLIRTLVDTRRTGAPWLTLAFDDGYLDAIEYVRTRAPIFPSVEWMVFVCPEKAEREAGFRWDVAGATQVTIEQAMQCETENARPELLAAGRAAESRIASVQAACALATLPNVTLGNHTNTHALQTRLLPSESNAEYARSIADFIRLLGPHRQFAFPFGTPHYEVTKDHVRQLWKHGVFDVWTTENRTYSVAERDAGAPLPRFSPDGRWSPGSIIFWMAAHSFRQRWLRRPPAFGVGFVRASVSDGEVAAPHSTTPAKPATRV